MIRFLALLLLLTPPVLASGDKALYRNDFTIDDGKLANSSYAHLGSGTYHIYATEGRLSWLGERYGSAVIGAKAEWIDHADNNAYGLLVRLQDDDNAYLFGLSGNGQYLFGGWERGEWFRLVSWTESPKVNKYGVNYLKVVCEDDKFYLYLNNELIETVQDGRFREGKVGFYAAKNNHAHFDDLVILDAGAALDFELNYQKEKERIRHQDDAFFEDVLFADDFSDKIHDWSESDFAHYEPGSYSILDRESGRYSWQNSIFVEDYIYDCDVSFVYLDEAQEDPRSAGIIFRADDADNLILFRIFNSGAYSLEAYEFGVKRTLVPLTRNSAILDTVNHLRVIDTEEQITLYANGVKLNRLKSDLLSFAGKVGFYGQKDTYVNFDNVRITKAEFDYEAYLANLLNSPCLYISAAIVALFMIMVLFGRRKKRKAREEKARASILNFIREKHGSITIAEVMLAFKMNKRQSESFMLDIVKEYGGFVNLDHEGRVTYDFPDFQPKS